MKIGSRKSKKDFTKERQLIAHHSPRSPISEQYRTLRTNIEFSSIDEPIRTILVTSTAPGEGKSTTAANLAIVFAQQGKKALIVDTDLRNPTVHYTFRIANTFGLTNVLTKQATLNEAIQMTPIKDVFVLTCGPIPPNPAELIGSESMTQFIQNASEQFDIVIFDTPPVLAVTDAQILANKVDGSILVFSSGDTNIDAAVKTKEVLMNAKSKLLGAVLNKKKAKDSQYYYYYGSK